MAVKPRSAGYRTGTEYFRDLRDRAKDLRKIIED